MARSKQQARTARSHQHPSNKQKQQQEQKSETEKQQSEQKEHKETDSPSTENSKKKRKKKRGQVKRTLIGRIKHSLRCHIRIIRKHENGGNVNLLCDAAQQRVTREVADEWKETAPAIVKKDMRLSPEFIKAVNDLTQSDVLRIAAEANSMVTTKRYLHPKLDVVLSKNLAVSGSHVLGAFKTWAEYNCPDAFRAFRDKTLKERPFLLSFYDYEEQYDKHIKRFDTKKDKQWMDLAMLKNNM